MGSVKISKSKKTNEDQFLHVNTTRRHITGCINVISFKDKDTKQYVMLIPSLELSSYGDTKKETSEMMKSAIDFFLGQLVSLTKKKMEEELKRLGWIHHPLKNKDYSMAFVDDKGALQKFNDENVKVELITV